jgi:hypothetical protein
VVSFWRTYPGDIHGARIYANGDLGIHTAMAERSGADLPLPIAPVPAVNTLTAWLPEASQVNAVQAIDPAGKVTTLPFVRNGDRLDLDADGLPNGAYALRVTTDGATLNGRFIVAR